MLCPAIPRLHITHIPQLHSRSPTFHLLNSLAGLRQVRRGQAVQELSESSTFRAVTCLTGLRPSLTPASSTDTSLDRRPYSTPQRYRIGRHPSQHRLGHPYQYPGTSSRPCLRKQKNRARGTKLLFLVGILFCTLLYFRRATSYPLRALLARAPAKVLPSQSR